MENSRIYKDKNEEVQSRAIDLLRFPLAIAVVCIHSFGPSSNVNFQNINITNFSIINLYDIIRVLISHVLVQFAVPAFFIISGYLFFIKISTFNYSTYINKIKRKWHTLIIPYFVWNIIAIFVIVTLVFRNGLINHTSLHDVYSFFNENGWIRLFWNCSSGSAWVNWMGVTTTITNPIDGPLWFLRDLIIMMFISPVIYYCIRKFNLSIIVVLGICYINKLWFNITGFHIIAVFFFSFGAYFAINKKNMFFEMKKFDQYANILFVLLLPFATYFNGVFTPIGRIIMPIFIILSVFVFFEISREIISKYNICVNPVFPNSSFFIFASHIILILPFSEEICNYILPGSNGIALLIKYFLTPLVCVSICMGLYVFLRKYVPALSKLLNGNR